MTKGERHQPGEYREVSERLRLSTLRTLSVYLQELQYTLVLLSYFLP